MKLLQSIKWLLLACLGGSAAALADVETAPGGITVTQLGVNSSLKLGFFSTTEVPPNTGARSTCQYGLYLLDTTSPMGLQVYNTLLTAKIQRKKLSRFEWTQSAANAGCYVVQAALLDASTSNISCGLTVTPATVAYGSSATLQITGNNLPAGAQGYLYGSKNGVNDQFGSVAIAAPGSASYPNGSGSAGTYVRYAQIRDSQGSPICQTNSITAVYQAPGTTPTPVSPTPVTTPTPIATPTPMPTATPTPVPLPVTCTLSASSTSVPYGSSMTFTVNGGNLPSGARSFFYGTKNGVSDISGQDLMPAPGSASFGNTAAGTYTRYVQVRDAQGVALCTTQTLTVVFQAPQPTCSLSGPSYVASGANWTYVISGSNLPSGAQGRWYGTKNGVTDVSGVAAGAMPATLTFTNAAGQTGNYTRQIQIYDSGGNWVCSTNTIATTLQ